MKKITFLLLILPIFSFSQWTQIGSDIDGLTSFEYSGYSVSLSSDGSTLAIGAYNHDSSKGKTRIYTNSGGTWSQVGGDIDGVDAGEHSGWSVSLSGDGNTVAIGAFIHDNKGTTRIYTNSGGTWSQVGGDIDGIDAGEGSGYSVSLSSDGNTVAIGAYQHDSSKGTTRVYVNSGGTWSQIGTDIDGVLGNEQSGHSVSLSDNGSIIAIGAYLHDSKGTTRIYTNSGGTWSQIGTDIDGVDIGEWFGYSVSLSGDGNTVAIGADRHDSNKGTTRIYENSGGTWSQMGTDIDGVDIGEWFGYSVSLSGDGNTVAIGAYQHDSGKGTARVYTNSAGSWIQVGSDIDGVDAGERSGVSISLSSDSNTVAIGANRHNSSKGTTRVYTNPVLSIENNTFGNSFNVYPNPSFGVSQIQLGEVYNEVSVAVFNVLGKQVATQTHNNTSDIKLNTQQFNSGVYFIKVQSGTKKATIKLVVN